MVTDIVARLLAIEEIKKLKARYSRLLDEYDCDAFAGLFTEDAHLEIAKSSSGVRTKDDFLAALEKYLTPAVSVHHRHLPEIDIVDERTATGVWAMFDSAEPPRALFRSSARSTCARTPYSPGRPGGTPEFRD